MKFLKTGLMRLNNAPYILLLFPPLFWSGNVVLGRAINQLIPPITLAYWRWTIALLILVPFTWRYVKKDWSMVKKNWKYLMILSFLGVACFNTLLYKSVQTTTAINSALIQSSMPAWTVLFSLVMFRERIILVQSLGVGLSLLGAFHIAVHGRWLSIAQLSFVEGDIWMIVAVILYACYSILLRIRPAIHDLSLLTITFAMGSFMLLPLYLWELTWAKPLDFNWQIGFSILYVAIFPSILAYLCWNRGIELIGANRASLYINLSPVFASILAVILLDESLHDFHLIGVCLIFIGMILFNRNRGSA